jgi:hypothetical protein
MPALVPAVETEEYHRRECQSNGAAARLTGHY